MHENAQKNNSVINDSSTSENKNSDESHSIGTSSRENDSKSKPKDDRDFITRILEGMSNFFQSIFS